MQYSFPIAKRISVIFGNGRRVIFTYSSGDNAWLGEDEYGHLSWITRTYQNGNIEKPLYVLETKGGMRYFFNAEGRLTGIRDPPSPGRVDNSTASLSHTQKGASPLSRTALYGSRPWGMIIKAACRQ